MKDDLDINRLNALAIGSIFPDNQAEKIFVFMFDQGRSGYLGTVATENLVKHLKLQYEMNSEDLQYLIIGYFMGQEYLEQQEEQINDKYGNNKVH